MGYDHDRATKPLDVEEPLDFYVFRRLAAPLARVLYDTPVTPNHVTTVALVVGVLSGLGLLYGFFAPAAAGLRAEAGRPGALERGARGLPEPLPADGADVEPPGHHHPPGDPGDRPGGGALEPPLPRGRVLPHRGPDEPPDGGLSGDAGDLMVALPQRLGATLSPS